MANSDKKQNRQSKNLVESRSSLGSDSWDELKKKIGVDTKDLEAWQEEGNPAIERN